MANIYGIDVSEHNGTLDWSKIKASGISFAIIRTGYGITHKDPQLENNLKGALSQGIPVGVYHFSYALTPEGAKKEAEFCLSLLQSYRERITLPVFFDFEYDTIRYSSERGVTLGKESFNSHAVSFLETVKAAGYRPGIYYNLDYRNRFVDSQRLGQYVQWYAQYNSTASWTGYDIWQYASTHTIPGISGNFDINVADETILQPPEVTPIFTDVPENTWYAEAVRYCVEHGLMQGTENGLFLPEKTLTRAEIAVIVMRLHKSLTE